MNLVESQVSRMKSIFHVLNDYRNSIIIVLAWILTSLMSSPENAFTNTISQLVRFFLYPVNLVLFNTDISNAGFSAIYIILVPLVIILTIGFLYLISTED